MSNQNKREKELKPCQHCGGDIAIRNPSGFCDHLYYPDACPTCKEANPSAWDLIQKENSSLVERVKRLEEAVSFFCSTVKSGERWTSACEEVRERALAQEDKQP